MPNTLLILLLVLLLPNVAFAEVSDKVPSIAKLWITGILLGGASFAAAIYEKWVALVFGIISLFFCFVHFSVIADPFVGEAIIKEQGYKYVFSVYGSIVVMTLPLLSGIYLNRKHKKTNKNT